MNILKSAFVLFLFSTLSLAGDIPEWNPDVYPISYWAGPPPKFTTLERYQEIKDANFTYAFPIYPGGTVEDTRRQLDLCQQVGLKAFIYDSRMSTGFSDAVKSALDAMIKDFSSHPALAGYFITDEPSASLFPSLGQVNAYLHEKDPKHPGYINLYPSYIRDVSKPAMGYATYEEHVRKFVEIVNPFAISYDHYHFDNSCDGYQFFENLATVRKVGLETHRPTWNIVQLTQWGNMRHLTEPEIRHEAMQTLAYGYKGLLWFTYWSPKGFDTSNNWQHAAINEDGTRDPHYDMVKRVNADVLAFGNELLHATSTSVYQLGTLPPGGTPAPTDAPITTKDKADLTIGLFTLDNHTLAFLANRDYKAPAHFTPTLPGRPTEQFDRATKEWRPYTPSRLDIPPADAVLLRW